MSKKNKSVNQIRTAPPEELSECVNGIGVEFCSKSQSGSAETLQTAPECVSRLPKCSGTGQGSGYKSAI